MSTKPILITGGTGFLGSALTHRLLQQGYPVWILSRSAGKVVDQFEGRVQAVTRIDQLLDAGDFRAVVNLAGAGIFDQRWTAARKALLRDSRIDLTEQLAAWMKKSSRPADVFISGSAVGYYGDQGDVAVNEDSPVNADFAQQLCADWEAAALQVEQAGGRVCIIRTGLVLGQGGGLLQRMLPAFRLGLGGRMGSGRQWMSWIHLGDWLAIVEAMMDNPDMRGPYNATAPSPVSNLAFSETLARVLHRPLLLPMPEAVLKLLLGEMACLVLGSQRVMPQRLLAQGFAFEYPELDLALRNILTSS